jgi:hypothetical protein
MINEGLGHERKKPDEQDKLVKYQRTKKRYQHRKCCRRETYCMLEIIFSATTAV